MFGYVLSARIFISSGVYLDRAKLELVGGLLYYFLTPSGQFLTNFTPCDTQAYSNIVNSRPPRAIKRVPPNSTAQNNITAPPIMSNINGIF